MMSLEVGEDEAVRPCECCSESTSTGHGFVYRDGSAFSIYYAAWSNAHPDRGVSLAIAIGEWDDGSTAAQRTCMGIEAREHETEIVFRVIGPESSPWPHTELLGRMLDRQAALTHPLKGEVLQVGEVVVRGHPAVATFLNIDGS